MKPHYALYVCLAMFGGLVSAQEVAPNPYVEFRVKTYDAQLDYLRAISSHQQSVMRDLEEKLSQQKWQTNAIAVMVFIMVAAGLALSYLQFRRDGKKETTASFSLKVGPGSLELSSSVIGLIILVLSFWFFQSYIATVYSVQVFDIPPIDLTTYGVNR